MHNSINQNVDFYAVVESSNCTQNETYIKCFVGKGSVKVGKEITLLLSTKSLVKTKIINVSLEKINSKVTLTIPIQENIECSDIVFSGEINEKSVQEFKTKVLLPFMYSQDSPQLKQEATKYVILNSFFAYTAKDDEDTSSDGYKILYNPEDKAFLPIFTSLNEKGTSNISNTPILKPFHEYIDMIFKSEKIKGLVINPFSDNIICQEGYLAFLKFLLENERIGGSKLSVQEGSLISFSNTDQKQDIVDYVKTYCIENKAIQKAWMCKFQYNDNKSELLVLDIQEDSEPTIIDLGKKIKQLLPNTFLDIVDNKSDEVKKGMHELEPFYIRREI